MAFLKNFWQAFNEDKVMRLASAIAFSTIFSIAPLLVILIAVVGWVLGLENGGNGRHLAESTVLREIRSAAGAETADTVQKLVTAAFARPRDSLIAQIIGWAAFALAATSLFSSLQDSLNAIWKIEILEGGLKHAIRTRIASFSMILVVGFLLLLTFVANTAMVYFMVHVGAGVVQVMGPLLIGGLESAISVVVGIIGFALIYKILPDVTIEWRDVWLGASITGVLFVLGEAVIARYLAIAGVASAYGAAGSLFAALLWIYYSAIILLVGAELTKLRAGAVATLAPSRIRHLQSQPAGIDPRVSETS